MFSNEQEALTYIDSNKQNILDDLDEKQIKTIYVNNNTRINVMSSSKSLLKCINRFNTDKKWVDLKID